MLKSEAVGGLQSSSVHGGTVTWLSHERKPSGRAQRAWLSLNPMRNKVQTQQPAELPGLLPPRSQLPSSLISWGSPAILPQLSPAWHGRGLLGIVLPSFGPLHHTINLIKSQAHHSAGLLGPQAGSKSALSAIAIIRFASVRASDHAVTIACISMHGQGHHIATQFCRACRALMPWMGPCISSSLSARLAAQLMSRAAS